MTLRKLFALTTIVLLATLVGCSGGETETAEDTGDDASVATFEVDSATAGAVTGKVNFSGKAPKRVALDMGGEASCAAAYDGKPMTENYVPGDNGTIQNVFVYVKSDFGGAKFATPADPVTLDQKDCRYVPHVIGVMARQTVRYINSDTVSHNIHPIPENNREWNRSQPGQSAPIEKAFPRTEMGVHVKCDVHPWMRSIVYVMSHPYFAVTGSDGSFSIGNLPPGEYTLVAVHEILGEQEMTVTIGDSETAETTFSFTAE